MKKLVSQAEIVFWNTAIALMSREKMPRLYSQTMAALTLRLQPAYRNLSLKKSKAKNTPKGAKINTRQWVLLAILSGISLAIGLVLGWIRSGL